MTTFNYRVKDKSGQALVGSVEGSDVRAVHTLLMEQGYFVLDIREEKVRKRLILNPFYLFNRYVINPLFAGATTYDLAQFYRRLHTMIRSGMSLIEAMSSITKQGGNRRLRKIAAESLLWIQGGRTLSSSFERYPWMFSEMQVNLIRAGESGGSLEGVLGRLADYLEWEHRLRGKVRMATLYPKILIIAVIFIPNLKDLVLGHTDLYIHETVYTLVRILVVLGIAWGIYRLLYQIKGVRYGIDLVKIAPPKIGKMVRMIALAKFYRSFAAMYSAGMPLAQGLYYAAGTVGNWYIQRRLLTAIPRVQEGVSLSDALRGTQVLPTMAQDMLSTGEHTGNVDEMMDKAGEYTENEAEVAVAQSTMILGILAFALVACYIGYIIVQFYTGYANDIGKELAE